MPNLRPISLLTLSLVVACASMPPPEAQVAPTESAATPATSQPDATHTLRLASTSWPPFADEQGRPRIALDLVARALTRAGYASSTEIVQEGTLGDALRELKFDGSGALWESDDREQHLLYSNPYLENKLVLVGASGSAVDNTTLTELKGKRLGIVESYAYGDALGTAPGITLVRAASTEENLRALLHGEVDYVLADDLVIHHMLVHYPGQLGGRIAISKKPLLRRSLHLAIQKSRADAETIIERFNQALRDMLKDGSYNELLEVEWIRTDIDGDGGLELVTAGGNVRAQPPERVYDLFVPVPSSNAPLHDVPPKGARFVIRGVPYDSWSAVPNDQKTRTDDLGAKPRTLRVEAFEF